MADYFPTSFGSLIYEIDRSHHCMLKNSFVLLDGIGKQREASIWRSGIETWDDFLSEPRAKGISESRKTVMDEELLNARRKLAEQNSSYFASRMRATDQWRCLPEFRKSIAFLDIETTGISLRSPITVVGIFDGSRMHSLVRGRDLTWSNLKAVLGSVGMLVTFNGSSFDLPMIESQFPGTVPHILHVDLKHSLRRIGLTGGLKKIERELDIQRDRRVEYMTGEDAVYLWRLWEKQNNMNALDLLLEYNSEDCVNLKALSDFAFLSLKKNTFDAVVRSRKD
jgi:uncharacterized protein YprB with RNaseH-like and TPR domain